MLRSFILPLLSGVLFIGCGRPTASNNNVQEESAEFSTCYHELSDCATLINNISNCLTKQGFLVAVTLPTNEVTVLFSKADLTGKVTMDLKSFNVFRTGGFCYTLEMKSAGQISDRQRSDLSGVVKKAFELSKTRTTAP